MPLLFGVGNSDEAEDPIDIDGDEVSDEGETDEQSDEEVELPQLFVPATSTVEGGLDVGGDEDFDMDKEREEVSSIFLCQMRTLDCHLSHSGATIWPDCASTFHV